LAACQRKEKERKGGIKRTGGKAHNKRTGKVKERKREREEERKKRISQSITDHRSQRKRGRG